MAEGGSLVDVQLQMEARWQGLDVVVEAECGQVVVARAVDDEQQEGVDDVGVVAELFLRPAAARVHVRQQPAGGSDGGVVVALGVESHAVSGAPADVALQFHELGFQDVGQGVEQVDADGQFSGVFGGVFHCLLWLWVNKKPASCEAGNEKGGAGGIA